MSFCSTKFSGFKCQINSVTKLIMTITNYLVTPTASAKLELFVAQNGLCSVFNIMFVLTTLASFNFFQFFKDFKFFYRFSFFQVFKLFFSKFKKVFLSFCIKPFFFLFRPSNLHSWSKLHAGSKTGNLLQVLLGNSDSRCQCYETFFSSSLS